MKITELLKVEVAAKRLGLKESTIRKRILKREIPFVKNGKSVRIPVEVVEEIIERGFRPAINALGK